MPDCFGRQLPLSFSVNSSIIEFAVRIQHYFEKAFGSYG